MVTKKQLRINSVNSAEPGAAAATYYWGLDRYTYPGDSTMQSLWNNTLLFFTGFYLGPTNDHKDGSWMSSRSTLVNQGWGIAPIYVGRQVGSSYLSQGKADADNAASLANSAGFPALTFIYLDVEACTMTSAFLDYIKAWVVEIAGGTAYWPGIYCSLTNASQIYNYIKGSSSELRFWIANWTVSNPDVTAADPYNPISSGFQYATIWQTTGNTNIPGLSSCDVNSSSLRDPGSI